MNLFLCFFPDDLSSSSLPLVNISASVSLSAADMTMYLKKMSRGEAVEGEGLTHPVFSRTSASK